MAATIRTSTGIFALPPIRRISFSCKARSSFAWVSSLISAISSRKIVPPPAASNRPISRRTAPVNAPRSWPNSSLSNRVSGREAQLTARNGAALRPLIEWTLRAITSFPVPLSPVRRMVLSLLATRGRIRLISRIAACSPRIGTAPGKSFSDSTLWDSRRCRFSMARSTMISRRARSTGFSK